MTHSSERFISVTCGGEFCFCGKPATNKVGEEIPIDHPHKNRHNLTSYVCAEHFDAIFMAAPWPEMIITDAVDALREIAEPDARDSTEAANIKTKLGIIANSIFGQSQSIKRRADELFDSLYEARITIASLKRNITSELAKGNHLWSGVPELLQIKIDQFDAMLEEK